MMKQVRGYFILSNFINLILPMQHMLDKYSPAWHVDGRVDNFLDSLAVTELMLLTSQNKPSFEIKVH